MNNEAQSESKGKAEGKEEVEGRPAGGCDGGGGEEGGVQAAQRSGHSPTLLRVPSQPSLKVLEAHT